MTAGELAENLMELRRHVVREPEHCRKEIGLLPLAGDSSPLSLNLRKRLMGNLAMARNYILAEPEMARCYLFCAAAEIRIEAGRKH